PIAVGLVGGLFGRTAENDRVVAIINRLQIDDWLLSGAAGVVPGPLAEWALEERIVGSSEPLQDDLRVGWNRQAGVAPADDLDRFTPEAANPLELVHVRRDLDPGGDKEDRIPAYGDGDGHRLIPGEVLIAMNAPVL